VGVLERPTSLNEPVAAVNTLKNCWSNVARCRQTLCFALLVPYIGRVPSVLLAANDNGRPALIDLNAVSRCFGYMIAAQAVLAATATGIAVLAM